MKLPKFDIKEIDFKQFFLQRGEWVGLGVALVIALPLLYSGISRAFSSGSPTANAKKVSDLAKNIQQHLNNDKAPEDISKPPPESELALISEPVDPTKFGYDVPWFVPSTMEDTKRREPVVLLPTDFHVEAVRGGALGNVFIKGENGGLRVAVLKEKEKNPRPRQSGRLNLVNQFAGMGSKFGSGAGGPGEGAAQGPGMMQQMMSRGFPGMPGMPGMGQNAGLTKTDIDWADLDKVENQSDVRLALDMYPARMIVVSGTFPFKEQLEQFRIALHKRSLNQLVAEIGTPEVPWQFKGFDIERRDYGPDGKLLSDWQNFTKQIEEAAVKVLAVVPDKAPEDPKLSSYEGIINPGLVMPLPPLARGDYPNQTPASLTATLKALDDAAKEHNLKPPPTLFMQKAKEKGINVWDPVNTFNQQEEEKKEEVASRPPPEPSKPQGSEEDGPEPVLPKDVLVRFYDRNIEPGHSYEYRIKVRMANPNHGPGMKRRVVYASLAKPEEIQSSEWAVIPKVKVPFDVEWYVMDNHGDRQTAEVQIHRWVDSVLANPNDERSGIRLGDWVIWDKAPMRRGEYLGRKQDVKVPKWAPEKEDYELAKNTATHTRRVPVDFSVEMQRRYDPTLVVDYEGGMHPNVNFDNRTISDEEPVQILVLTPEGKLTVRNSADDRNDENRKKRFDKIKEQIAEAEKPKSRNNAMGPTGLFDKGMGGKGAR